jgi:hypothetical protein
LPPEKTPADRPSKDDAFGKKEEDMSFLERIFHTRGTKTNLYVSDFEQFLNRLKHDHPDLDREQMPGRALLWDKVPQLPNSGDVAGEQPERAHTVRPTSDASKPLDIEVRHRVAFSPMQSSKTSDLLLSCGRRLFARTTSGGVARRDGLTAAGRLLFGVTSAIR